MKPFDIHSDSTIDSDLRQLLPKNIAHRYAILPHQLVGDTFHVYISEDKISETTKQYLEAFLGKKIVFTALDRDLVLLSLSKHYGREGNTSESSISIDKNNFLDQLIVEAKEHKSSDIHIEKFELNARIRFRIDGHLIERFKIPLTDYPELVNKVKIVANLDIAEKRLPQDGRINYDKNGHKLDLRVSILPTLYGEKVVLRLLEKDSSNLQIGSLGLNKRELEVFMQIVSKPNGLVLISGPTGSGKTTTLYATLKELNTDDVNILTVEDPVEYTLEGINQVQLNEKVGLTFPQALRSFLRQDPDIVMLGEIRDIETAQMATRAALTGHLVFSTVHTNSALGIFNRLIEMGVSEYLLMDTLNAGIAQRLIRTLCPQCKEEGKVSDLPLPFRSYKVKQVFHPIGCMACLGTGYQGRKAIYEIVPNSSELVLGIKNSAFDISAYLQARGLVTLSSNAVKLLSEGETSVEEVLPFLHMVND